MKNKWKADEFAENKLNLFAIDHEVKEINLDEIDEEQSRINHARNVPFDNDSILDYACDMQRGAVFPRIVLRHGKHGYVILGGNQRHQAMKLAGIKSCEAYVCKPLDSVDDVLLPKVLNRGHGKKESRQEAINAAVQAVAQGKSEAWAAEAFGLGEQLLRDSIRINQVRLVLSKAGVNVAGMCATNLLKLASVKNENVMTACGRIIADTGIVGSQLEQFLKEVKEATRSEATQMAVVARYQEAVAESQSDACEDTPPGNTATGNRKNASRLFLMVLANLESIIKGKRQLAQFGEFDEPQSKKIKGRIFDLSKRLYAIATAKS